MRQLSEPELQAIFASYLKWEISIVNAIQNRLLLLIAKFQGEVTTKTWAHFTSYLKREISYANLIQNCLLLLIANFQGEATTRSWATSNFYKLLFIDLIILSIIKSMGKLVLWTQFRIISSCKRQNFKVRQLPKPEHFSPRS